MKISGKVQGVFFRNECRTEALKLGLNGWAKNNSDGSVSVVVQGGEENLQALLRWCELGPENVKVDKIEKEWTIAKKSLDGFEIG